MARKVTLYIEDTEIKLLVLAGNKVEKWASLVLEEGLVEQGLILDEKKVSAAIQQLFKLQAVHDHTVTLGLSGLNSIFRIITIPKVNNSLLPEAISNEASRVLPVPLSQVYHAYQQLASPNKDEMRFFLAAYPRQTTDALINTVHKAGLKPSLLDLAPLALARYANAPQAILVNAWLTFLDIVILVDRVPQVIRSVLLPVESASAQERLASIAEELSRTITFYNTSYPDKPLDKAAPVFVCGDLAREEEGWSYLGKLDFPVSNVKAPVEFKESFNPTQFAVNIGLALKGEKAGREGGHFSLIDFNAIPQAHRPPPFSLWRVLAPVGAVVAVGALGYGWLMVQDIKRETAALESQTQSIAIENAHLRASIKSLKSSIAESNTVNVALPTQATTLKQSIAALQNSTASFNNFLSGLQKGLVATDVDLQQIVALAPAGVKLEGIETDPDVITIKGQAENQGQVLAYAKALQASGRFTVVTVSAISKVEAPESPTGSAMEFILDLS